MTPVNIAVEAHQPRQAKENNNKKIRKRKDRDRNVKEKRGTVELQARKYITAKREREINAFSTNESDMGRRSGEDVSPAGQKAQHRSRRANGPFFVPRRVTS